MLLEKIKSLAKQHQAENISIRRHLHANPELSYQEFETSKYVQAQLKAIGIPFTVIATTGVLGIIEGKNPSKRIIALRADMDALPIIEENKVEKENTFVIFEITLSNLRSEGEIDERDFMDRAELLCSLGQTVMISNFQEYYKVVEYFSSYTKARMGLVMGVNNLVDIFDEKYYRHLSGGILEAFGKLFYRDLKVYLYPMLNEEKEVINSENLKVHPRMKELYKFFKYNGKVTDIESYDEKTLDIFSRKILKMICKGETGWEEMLPDGTAEIIKKDHLFGYLKEKELAKS